MTGRLVEESDCEPIVLKDGDIVMLEEFPYLGSLIDSSGRATVDVKRRVAQASRAFGHLINLMLVNNTNVHGY